MLMKFVFESASGEGLQSCLKGFASRTSQDLMILLPNCIFMFTKELQKSAVYSDWEEKQKYNFFRITDLHVADFFMCVLKECAGVNFKRKINSYFKCLFAEQSSHAYFKPFAIQQKYFFFLSLPIIFSHKWRK